MGNLSRESFNVLPEFQRFLQERKLVQEKNAPYFAYRVSRFLAFARQRDIASDEYQETAVIEFLEGKFKVFSGTKTWRPRWSIPMCSETWRMPQ